MTKANSFFPIRRSYFSEVFPLDVTNIFENMMDYSGQETRSRERALYLQEINSSLISGKKLSAQDFTRCLEIAGDCVSPFKMRSDFSPQPTSNGIRISRSKTTS